MRDVLASMIFYRAGLGHCGETFKVFLRCVEVHVDYAVMSGALDGICSIPLS